MFVVVEGRYSTCHRLDPSLLLSLKHMVCHARTYEISGNRHNNLLVCPLKDSRSWPHMSIRTTDGTYLKKILSVRPKTALGVRKRKKRMAIAKHFALHENAIKKQE